MLCPKLNLFWPSAAGNSQKIHTHTHTESEIQIQMQLQMGLLKALEGANVRVCCLPDG